MGSFEMRCRINKVPSVDIGIRVVAVLEGEGLNGFMVTWLDPKSEAVKWLIPGDRIVYTNGIPARNFSKFMEGVCHKWFLETLDCQFFRYIPMEKSKKVINGLHVTKYQARLLALDEEWTVLSHAPESGINLHDTLLSINGVSVAALPKPWDETVNELPNDTATLKLSVQRGGLHHTVEQFVKAPRPDCDYFHAYFRHVGDPRPLGLFVKEAGNMIIISTTETGTQGWGVVEPLDRILAINSKIINTSAECGVEMVSTNPNPFRLIVERARTVGRRAYVNKLVSPKVAQANQEWFIPPPAPDLQTGLAEVMKAPQHKIVTQIRGILRGRSRSVPTLSPSITTNTGLSASSDDNKSTASASLRPNMPPPAAGKADALGSVRSNPAAPPPPSAVPPKTDAPGSVRSNPAAPPPPAAGPPKTDAPGSVRSNLTLALPAVPPKTDAPGSVRSNPAAPSPAVAGKADAAPGSVRSNLAPTPPPPGGIKRGVVFSQEVVTTEIYQDVVPKKRKASL